MPVFMLFLLWPLVEIALFVTLGGALGLWLTLLVVLGTGILGIVILRRLGYRSAERLRVEMGRLHDPLGEAGNSLLVAIAAILLVLPGFLTDFMGALLLLPPVRAVVVSSLARRFGVHSMRSDQPARRSDGIVIDGEFVEIDPENSPKTTHPSGWTRH